MFSIDDALPPIRSPTPSYRNIRYHVVGAAAAGRPSPTPTARNQLGNIGPLHSGLVAATSATESAATIAADPISSVVVLFTKEVGIDEVEAKAALADAPVTRVTAVTTAAPAGC